MVEESPELQLQLMDGVFAKPAHSSSAAAQLKQPFALTSQHSSKHND